MSQGSDDESELESNFGDETPGFAVDTLKTGKETSKKKLTEK